MNVVEVSRGTSPVVLGQPHGGTFLPSELAARLNENGRRLSDTDWHIERLYRDLLPEATTVASTVHRYVIDANRDPSGVSLYPGQNTTGLCPVTDFDGKSVWKSGMTPRDDEVETRRARYHAPYHKALGDELHRVHAQHGVAILFDCHSIRSRIPFLFEGTLPVFNIGTNGGKTCAGAVRETVETLCRAADGYETVVDGRFRGGWTTRHYGRPKDGIHAVQLEIAQRAYLHETPPWTWNAPEADRLRGVLAQVLRALEQLALSGALHPKGESDV